jgi:hypothetical protein
LRKIAFNQKVCFALLSGKLDVSLLSLSGKAIFCLLLLQRMELLNFELR